MTLVTETFNNQHTATTSPSCGLAERVEQLRRALTVKEVAELMQVSPMTIYRLAARKAVASFRVGDSLRFDPKAVAAFLRN
jgi:excisionase family DNA binding protein